MSWLDILILLPLVLGLIRGLMRGLIKEIIAIVAIIAGFISVKLWGVSVALWLSQQVTWPEAVCTVVTYALLFIVSALLLNIIARLLSKLFKAVYLGWLNRLLGGFFGVIKWGVIMLFIVLCVHRLDTHFHFINNDLKSHSIVYNHTTPLAEKMWKEVKKQSIQISSQQAIKQQSNKDKNNQQKTDSLL